MKTRQFPGRRARGLLLVLVPGLLFTFVASAWASARTSGPESNSTGTNSSRVLRVLGSAREEYVRGVVRSFEQETGVRTTYEALSAGEALLQLKSQASAPGFSVWWGGSADTYVAAQVQGLLAPYRPRGSGVLPRKYVDSQDYWTGIYVGVLGFALNREALAERGLPEPSSWADLSAPRYTRTIAIGHPATSGSGYTALATIVQLHGKSVDEGFDYARALHNNIAVYTRDAASPATLACHQVPIGIALAYDIEAAREDGCDSLDIVFPREGTGYEIGAMALLNNAPEPELAKQFMDWAITPHAQELGPLFTAYQIPTNPDARVPARAVRLGTIETIDYDFRWAGERRDMLSNRFSALIAPIPTSPDLPN